MKDPLQEQAAVDDFVSVEVLVLDDLGDDTPFSRQLLQEILDFRDFHYRAGLVVTSKYSLDDLATKLADDTIPSRLAGMCQVVEIQGIDHRLDRRNGNSKGQIPESQSPILREYPLDRDAPASGPTLT